MKTRTNDIHSSKETAYSPPGRKMDESWRMPMGITMKPNLPRRKSTEETSRRAVLGDSETLDPDDFNDVFGGPPRTVLCHQFFGDFTRSTLLYEEMFPHPESLAPANIGQNLPEFRIPASRGSVQRCDGENFYSDIFRSDDDMRRSRSRSKTNSKSKSTSSSVLSSEDLSPLRSAVTDDVTFSLFASKLRPINVPCRQNLSTRMPKEQPRQEGMPAFSCNRGNLIFENEYNENFRSAHFGCSRQVSSPETIILEPNSCVSVKVSMDDLELNSPSSVVSSLCQHPEAKASKIQDKVLQEQEVEQEEDEVMSSYVIEINSDYREGANESLAIDEAIAWAKEKFQTQNSGKDWSKRQYDKEQSAETEERSNAQGISGGQRDEHGSMQSKMEKEPNKWATEDDKQKMEHDLEMETADENARSWSAGKEANIRLLLSTLHHILWPDSGWYAIPLTNLIESSHVKKAYQKARLCLHPDKLQQRGATVSQKYVAEKAFSILQDAWATFISQDIFFS
ncbi:hypothetical protein F0562_018070 [Nyssa sinensis]|uniref:J domain-containing protein n=1 Tax=Nyssa sinensis TaxID=561372 RepID=A0A5J4ZCB5_9ASTE|nr:hypothetical protein F0562_018070 [Nyssa sinensis]